MNQILFRYNESMDGFFIYDPLTAGSKGLVFIGNKVLVYRRDNNTKLYPLYIDLPGGGLEPNETPFETFEREVYEEFGLKIHKEDITYVKKYPGVTDTSKYAYFPVAKLPEEAEKKIKFGNEGLEYMVLELDDYFGREDLCPILRERSLEYVKSLR